MNLFFSVYFLKGAFTSSGSFHSIFINIRLQVVKKLNAHYLAFFPTILIVSSSHLWFIHHARSFFLSVQLLLGSLLLTPFPLSLSSRHRRRHLRWHRRWPRQRRQQHQRATTLRHFCRWLTDWRLTIQNGLNTKPQTVHTHSNHHPSFHRIHNTH